MKNKVLIALCVWLIGTSIRVSAQDKLLLQTGVDIKCKVLELTPTEVKYKNWDNLNGPTITIIRSTAFMVSYENGKTEVLNTNVAATSTPSVITGKSVEKTPLPDVMPTLMPTSAPTAIVNTPLLTTSEWSERGQQDARLYYRGEKSGKGWVGGTSALLSPIVGLVVAAGCVDAVPQDHNLRYRDPDAMRNMAYKNAYITEAHKIKKRQIWNNFAMGSALWLLLVSISASTAK